MKTVILFSILIFVSIISFATNFNYKGTGNLAMLGTNASNPNTSSFDADYRITSNLLVGSFSKGENNAPYYTQLDNDIQVGTFFARLKTGYVGDSTSVSDIKTINYSLDVTNTLMVYPCLVTDELKMRWKEKNNTRFNLAIYDVSGKLVLNCTKLKGQSYTTDVSHLKPGVHVLKVNDALTDKLIAVRKFIKK
ncbi:MAG: T9SS C-terminal target domain-containing protein [Sphingobacteriales bacterium]|nr:MAG: T9SS C-terminal target domain-containing protein [Sphingobacteriales bacterium]